MYYMELSAACISAPLILSHEVWTENRNYFLMMMMMMMIMTDKHNFAIIYFT